MSRSKSGHALPRDAAANLGRHVGCGAPEMPQYGVTRDSAIGLRSDSARSRAMHAANRAGSLLIRRKPLHGADGVPLEPSLF